jgi:hypothetical protein
MRSIYLATNPSRDREQKDQKMWRTNAVISILVEDVAELRILESPDDSPKQRAEEQPELEALTKARRRAILVSLVDWIAILILMAFHSAPTSFLSFGASTDTVFTLGVLAVATHAGFRLGQARTYKVVTRVCEDLWEREGN